MASELLGARRPEPASAIVGTNVNAQGDLNEWTKTIPAVPFVASLSIVTRHVDILARLTRRGRSRAMPCARSGSSASQTIRPLIAWPCATAWRSKFTS